MLALCLAVAACDSGGPPPKTFQGVDITGADYGTQLALTGHDGKPRSLQDFRGKVVLLFFGFTHCPDVCPTTLSDMNQVMKLLGKDAERVQVLFVTVDPERDTEALLAKYVPSFNPAFLGLRGDLEATRKAAKNFHVFYEKRPGKTEETYTMDHFAATYVLDGTGRLRLLFTNGMAPSAMAADVRTLLAR